MTNITIGWKIYTTPSANSNINNAFNIPLYWLWYNFTNCNMIYHGSTHASQIPADLKSPHSKTLSLSILDTQHIRIMLEINTCTCNIIFLCWGLNNEFREWGTWRLLPLWWGPWPQLLIESFCHPRDWLWQVTKRQILVLKCFFFLQVVYFCIGVLYPCVKGA